MRIGKFLNLLKFSSHIKKKCHSGIYEIMEFCSHLLRLPLHTSPASSAKGESFQAKQRDLSESQPAASLTWEGLQSRHWLEVIKVPGGCPEDTQAPEVVSWLSCSQ